MRSGMTLPTPFSARKAEQCHAARNRSCDATDGMTRVHRTKGSDRMATNGNVSVVVITGASAGIGRATARAFARRGARIGLLARGLEGLEGARQDIERLGGRALVVPTDVADAAQVEAAAARVEAELGPIDIWVNNAMASVFSPIKEMTPDDVKRVTE